MTEKQVGMEEKSGEAFEKNLYYQAEDYSSSLEESEKNSYNEEEMSAGSSLDTSLTRNDSASNSGGNSAGSKEAIISPAAAKDNEEQSNKKTTEVSSGSKEDALNADEKEQGAQDKKPVSLKDTRKNIDEQERKKYEGKEVYLTFDDGPSGYTDDILNILDKYHVKATFFVIGKTDEQSKKSYKRIVEEGHSIGMHSYSHDYDQIYKSLKAFESDYKRIRQLIYETTGLETDIYRFPGGSGNEVSSTDMSVFIRYLNKENVVYYDWNVASGDATGVNYKPEQLCDNILEGIADHTRSIVLMHDTDAKLNTVRSLDSLLSTLTESGAKLLALNDTVKPIQQVKLSSSELYNK
ncbi:polysaccharide deacetylase family protein [Anaerocolumna xylanovorans]|uniref:polysaccharide deacetylase family protein n=1 Tax=Anaerocolumna xylanovorans TaxID=100134 RepID=UPI0015881A62|nr:polysaccharide deacetylase family protein [Anaerocolumna xylanovorans]